MNYILPLLLLSTAILNLAPTRATSSGVSRLVRRLSAGLPILLLSLGYAAIVFGFLTKTSDLLTVSAFAILLAAPWTSPKNLPERTAHVSTALAAIIFVLLIFGAIDAPVFASQFSAQFSLLVIGLIGVMGLLGSTFAAAASLLLRNRLPLVLFGAFSALAAFLLGILRSNTPGLDYSIPLATASQQPLFWVLAPPSPQSDGLRFALSMPNSVVGNAILAILILASLFFVFSIIFPQPTENKGKFSWQHFLVLFLTAAALVAVLAVDTGFSTLKLPPQELFETLARTVGKIPNMSDSGVATSISGSYRLSSNVPYLSSMGLAVSQRFFFFDKLFLHLSLASFIILFFQLWFSPKLPKEKKLVEMELNTFTTILSRGSIFAGFLVAGAGLYQMRYLGVAWIGSSSEWIGIALFSLFLAAAYATNLFRRDLLLHSAVDACEEGKETALLSKKESLFLIVVSVLLSLMVLLSLSWASAYHTIVGYSAILF